jgi:spermidine synthase
VDTPVAIKQITHMKKNSTSSSPHPGAYLGLALLAGSVMAFELALIRMFSFIQWHHFAFMVISMALLGFGISGIALQLWPRLGNPIDRSAGLYTLLFGLSAIAVTFIVARIPFAPTHITFDATQWALLFALYMVLTLPFIWAGLAVVTLLNGYSASADRLYGGDLLGAGLGSLTAVLTIQKLGADGLVFATGAAAALAAAFMVWMPKRTDHPLPKSSSGLRRSVFYVAVALLLSGAVPFASRVLLLRPGSTKGLAKITAGGVFPEARIIDTEWSAIARVDVVSDAGSIPWLNNPFKPTTKPKQLFLVIDGDAATPIVSFDGDWAPLGFLDHTLSSAGVQAFSPERALVIGAGGGVDVLASLYHGVRHVDAVEVNPIITNWVTGRYAEYSGHLFNRDDVTLHQAEGRSFVRSSPTRWDFIQLSLIDTWAASASGAYALMEGYLYTVEAFEDYFRHLTDRGVLSITRWVGKPPRESLKLVTVAEQALKNLGAKEPSQHMVVLAVGGMANVLVKREPFEHNELMQIRATAQKSGFLFLYSPQIQGRNAFFDYFATRHRATYIEQYPFDVSPATDDAPFFFQFARWRDVLDLGTKGADASISGRLLLLAVLVQSIVASILLLLLPMWRLKRRQTATSTEPPRTLSRMLTYFFAIGVAFMLIEVTFMQRFTLYLGHPVYAVAFVLTVLLIAAGLGSYASRWCRSQSALVFLLLILVVGVYALALPFIFQMALGLPLLGRLGVGVALLMPLGFLMGMPLPMALVSLSQSNDNSQIGWAWAANGCASVIGPVLASLLAFDLGFTVVAVLAALLYAVAYMTTWYRGVFRP